MRIDLIRHGACLDNAFLRGHSPARLSSLGERQLQAAFLAIPTPDFIISSPAQRCVEQAKAFYGDDSEQGGDKFQCCSDFQERYFGVWDGLSYEAVQSLDQTGLKAYIKSPFDYDITEAESLKAFEKRVLSAFDKVLSMTPKEGETNREGGEKNINHILIVTHGGVIRVLLKNILKMDNKSLYQFDIGMGSRVTLECFKLDPEPQLCNDSYHSFTPETQPQDDASPNRYFIKLVELVQSSVLK